MDFEQSIDFGFVFIACIFLVILGCVIKIFRHFYHVSDPSEMFVRAIMEHNSPYEHFITIPLIARKVNELPLMKFHPMNKPTKEIVNKYIEAYNDILIWNGKDAQKFKSVMRQKIIIMIYYLRKEQTFNDEKYKEFKDFEKEFIYQKNKTLEDIKQINNKKLSKRRCQEISKSFDFILRIIIITNDKFWIDKIKSCKNCKNKVLCKVADHANGVYKINTDFF
jgi:hypothetical protein